MRGLSSVVCVAFVVGVVAASQHETELKQHYDHLSYIAKFSCHQPQPRVISVNELFPESDRQHKAFFPDVTVLHRCDTYVGCCESNQVCRPKHTHPVNLPFKVTFLEKMGNHKRGSWVIDNHNLVNHTECECVDASVCVPPTEQHEEDDVQPKPAHKPDHESEISHHEPDHKSESSHQTEQDSSSYKPYQPNGDTDSGYIPLESSSASPEESPDEESCPPDNGEESSTLPLLVNYILGSTTPSTTGDINEKDLGAFFD